MFGPSLKSVPGCLVSMVPMLIGVPVALTPGFGPHFEVSALAPELEPPELLELLELLPEPPLLELLLLPHPASSATTTAATSAWLNRSRDKAENILTYLSLLLED
jgi:hypothetical protein